MFYGAECAGRLRPWLALHVVVFDGGAVVHVLAPAAAADGSPKIIEHVAVESDALAGLQTDHPDADAVAFRNELASHARVGTALLALEFGCDLGWPGRIVRALRLLFDHRQRHGIPPE